MNKHDLHHVFFSVGPEQHFIAQCIDGQGLSACRVPALEPGFCSLDKGTDEHFSGSSYDSQRLKQSVHKLDLGQVLNAMLR